MIVYSVKVVGAVPTEQTVGSAWQGHRNNFGQRQMEKLKLAQHTLKKASIYIERKLRFCELSRTACAENIQNRLTCAATVISQFYLGLYQ
jgi:hypothetical protein